MSLDLLTVLGLFLVVGLLGYMGLKTKQRFRDLEKRLRDLDQRLQVLKNFDKIIENQGRMINETRGVVKTLSDGQRELAITAALSSLGFRYPLFFGGWSIDAFLAREILGVLEQRRPRVVIELGSGASTVFIATVLQRLGLHDTRHIAVDHLDSYLEATRRQLQLAGLDGKTELWLCPLVEREADGPRWYEGLETRLAGLSLDFVLVDGPPGSLHPRSRQPALDLLKPMLSDDAVLLLDDAVRPEEQAIVAAWKKAHPELSIHMNTRGHGYAVVKRAEAEGAPTMRQTIPPPRPAG